MKPVLTAPAPGTIGTRLESLLISLNASVRIWERVLGILGGGVVTLVDGSLSRAENSERRPDADSVESLLRSDETTSGKSSTPVAHFSAQH